MRRLFTLAGSLFLLAAAGNAASSTGRYRIELKDGRQIETRGYPVARGSVWTFHASGGGALTGVPREMVVGIVPDDEAVEPGALVPARAVAVASTSAVGDLEEAPAPLEPGELIELPSTGDGPGAVLPAPGATRTAAGVLGNGNGNGYGGLPSPYNGNSIFGTSNGLPPGAIGPDGMPRVLSSTDLSRALSATTPAGSVGSNGFTTVTPTSPTMVGPDGTPTLGTGVSTQFVIGPDGTPVLAGSAGTPTAIGPNGTPTLAGAGQTGFAGPAIGPNGTPVLAGAGQPGSAAPMIGSNGTPVLAPAGQPGSAIPTIGSNGTPAVPAPGGHH